MFPSTYASQRCRHLNVYWHHSAYSSKKSPRECLRYLNATLTFDLCPLKESGVFVQTSRSRLIRRKWIAALKRRYPVKRNHRFSQHLLPSFLDHQKLNTFRSPFLFPSSSRLNPHQLFPFPLVVPFPMP